MFLWTDTASQCPCGAISTTKTCKNGDNAGREFRACWDGNGPTRKCDHFEWTDGASGTDGGGYNGSNPYSGAGDYGVNNSMNMGGYNDIGGGGNNNNNNTSYPNAGPSYPPPPPASPPPPPRSSAPPPRSSPTAILTTPSKLAYNSNARQFQHMSQVMRINEATFGHYSLRPGQDTIISAALTGQDVFVLMPTGGGKSLCYQLPAVYQDGLAVVISPLISLIVDQCQGMAANDVRAVYLSGKQNFEEEGRGIMQVRLDEEQKTAGAKQQQHGPSANKTNNPLTRRFAPRPTLFPIRFAHRRISAATPPKPGSSCFT